jgi:hypothetical protein
MKICKNALEPFVKNIGEGIGKKKWRFVGSVKF